MEEKTYSLTQSQLEEVAKEGACQALERVGLSDKNAGKDIEDIREMLGAWRTAKSTVWVSIWKLISNGIVMGIVISIALYIKKVGGHG